MGKFKDPFRMKPIVTSKDKYIGGGGMWASEGNTRAFVGDSGEILQMFHDACYLMNLAMVYTGAVVDIPLNWHICDGSVQNGKTLKDLRDKFIVGAGSTYAVDATGGATSHSHIFTGSEVTSGAASASVNLATLGLISVATGTHTHKVTAAGTTPAQSILPPYYALAWIEPI